MKQYIFFLLAVIFFTLTLGARSVNADLCNTQYGGTTTCVPSDLTVNKQVMNPITNLFVENLSTTDATFSPDQQVLFRLLIKNTSGQTFFPVHVTDVFPNYLTFVSGPGTYDAPSRTLSFDIDHITAGDTQTVQILAKVEPKSAFPAGKSFFCVVNTANVSSLNRNDQDTAQVCIQTSVLGTTTLPVAGFNDLLLLLPFAGVGLGGLTLIGKKK